MVGEQKFYSNEEIARDSFRIYRGLQKKYYKKIMKGYAVWVKISTVLIILFVIGFAATQDHFFIWMSGAYCLTGLIASLVTSATREIYRQFYRLEVSDEASMSQLDMSQCVRKGKRFVLYEGRKYPRVGCTLSKNPPGFYLVSCEEYSYIVEIKEPDAKELLTT